MLKERIKYTDYNDQPREEDFYFNLSKAEITEMELSIDGGLVAKIERIVEQKNGSEIMAVFKQVILKSYGEKSPDGKRFIKSEELSTAFSQTEAYSNLFVRLCTSPEEAARFINGVIPQEAKK